MEGVPQRSQSLRAYLQRGSPFLPKLTLAQVLVVLALQDRLAYGPTFESAMAALFGNGTDRLHIPAGALEELHRGT